MVGGGWQQLERPLVKVRETLVVGVTVCKCCQRQWVNLMQLKKG